MRANHRHAELSGQRKPPSVSGPLRILAGFVLMLVIGTSAQQLLAMRHAIVADTERQMARLDMVFAEQTGRAVETVNLMLRSALETLQEDRADPPVDKAAFEDLLRRRLDGVRQATGLIVADVTGRVIYASRPELYAMLPPEGQALLADYRAHPGPEVRISAPFRAADGTWTALVTRPVLDADRTVTGLGAAYLNLAYFEDFYRAVDLSENGSIILHLRNGTVLARYPHVDAAIGTSFADTPPFKDVLARDVAGTLLMESPIDGSIRVTAIRALRAFPLAMMVSVDQGRLLTGWEHEAWLLALAALCASAVIVGLLLLLARRSRQIERLVCHARAATATAEEANRRLREQMAERESAEAALRQAQRIEAIGQLTGGVAHDFNNLLTVVIGNFEMIDRAPDKLDRVRRLARVGMTAARRGAELTGKLLAFSRRQMVRPEVVDVNKLLRDFDAVLRRGATEAIRMEFDLDPNLAPTRLDPGQLEAAVLNLVGNARDAMPSGGTIRIVTRNVRLLGADIAGMPDGAEGAYVRIAVSDTGAGMDSAIVVRAFEPYYTTKEVGKGTGLGLSQVYGFSKQAGGFARIVSAPGEGTRVELLLPQCEEAVPAREADADLVPLPRAAAGEVVLVVEDEASVLEIAVENLTDLGYATLAATDAAEALERLRSCKRIDILFSDVVMPGGMSGVQLAVEARRLRPDLKVLLTSGYTSTVTEQDMPFDMPLLPKPYQREDLASKLEVLVGT
jgi:signal transduction histidine kinase